MESSLSARHDGKQQGRVARQGKNNKAESKKKLKL
jgi:hypothetical protein